MENILKLSKSGSSLGLRELAKKLGLKIKESISQNQLIIIDFENVESVSSSFADELIAKVMIEVGQENFIKNVKLKNTNDFIKTIINTSVRDRLNVRTQDA